ncbi:MAG: endonuclease/exonuclease/phosphatase family protein [Chthoniobacteraceae bacterium]
MIAALLVRYLLRLVAIVLVVVALLPFIRTNLWWVRLCDFPRLQVAGLALALLLAAFCLRGNLARADQVLAGLLAVAVFIEAWFIFPFTPLARETVRDERDPAPERTLRVVTANVLMENRDATALLAILRERDPDIILLAEPDAWWIEQCRPLEASHRFTVLHPQGNTYGMALYSRLELVAPEVLFRVEPGVPSIRAGVRLPSGTLSELHAVHPRPPGIDPPGAEERQSSAPRDAELILVATEIAERGVPALVVGDFNDVAWSHTTRLFQRLGRLLDPRVGRGLFNTFHAQHPLMRYPLDHVFHTRHFSLAGLERLPDFGSDHFPMFAAPVFQPDAAPPPAGTPAPTGDDLEEAKQAIRQAAPEKVGR